MRAAKSRAVAKEATNARFAWRSAAILVTAVVLSLGHSIYLWTLFENDRFFSHLSDLEREMSYRTEMGLYFSYYKTFVEAPTIAAGIGAVTHDTNTEAGHTINALERFNVYPEVALGVAFRGFRALVGNHAHICFHVRRGDALPPVESCEGIGNAHFFYIYAAFGVAGSVLGAVFVAGVLLSSSWTGGALAALLFVVNHGHATRVQWTPPLRETWGYAAYALQAATLTHLVAAQMRAGRLCWTAFAALTASFLIVWQFAGFVLFTQLVCLFGVYALGLLGRATTRRLLFAYAIAFFVAFIAMFGNRMLLSSLFLAALVAFSLIALLTDGDDRKWRIGRTTALGGLFIALTLTLKFAVSRLAHINDDSHIFDILRAKFTDYADFHTSLYTCAAEFDFIDAETLRSITASGLVPLAGAALALIAVLVVRRARSPSSSLASPIDESTAAALLLNGAQVTIFVVMAALIMRLKLFAVPHLCIAAPALFNTELQQAAFGRRAPVNTALLVLVAALIAFNGRGNVEKQLAIRGEFSNEPQELLFRWIMETPPSEDARARLQQPQ